jgi:asparaginyl-tRNA synthetase
MRVKIKDLKHPRPNSPSLVGHEVTIKGWIRTVRNQKTFTFVEVNDGSTLSNFQVILTPEVSGYDKLLAQLSTGCSIAALVKNKHWKCKLLL